MRRPSRSMPPTSRQPLGWAATTIVLLFFGIGFVALVVCFPLLWIVIGAIVVLTVVEGTLQNRRLSRLAIERQGESICTFARSFDYRAIDTWILRAVFEELQPWCKSGKRVLPLRAADDLEQVLGIDLEDLEELIGDIADRAQRSIENCEQNPLAGKIKTVSDLVSFLMHQPSRKVA